jgi:hypothetical protein
MKAAVWLMLLSAIIFSCNKENNTTTKTKTHEVGNANIVYTGSIAADGCGWLVKIASNYYHADNLPEQFQKNSLNVNINYKSSTSKFQCSINPNNLIPVIHLNSINNISN